MTSGAPYVQSPEPLPVVVDGPRGRFRGLVQGWAGDRVYVSWTEAPGMRYLRWLPASSVERVTES